MRKRYALLILFVLVVTNTVTALVLQHYYRTRDYAEITIENNTGNTIQTLWLKCASFERREHGVKGRKTLRFYVDEGKISRICQLVVTLDSGEGQSCDVEINNGEKSIVYVYQDRIECDQLESIKL